MPFDGSTHVDAVEADTIADRNSPCSRHSGYSGPGNWVGRW